MIHFAVVNPHGRVIGLVEDNVEDAIDTALEIDPDRPIQVQEPESEPQENPPTRTHGRQWMPEIALQRCGIPPIDPSAASMSLEEAHARLQPYFSGLLKGGKEVRAYMTSSSMLKAWIGQNYKTKKEHPEQPSLVMGLTLTPAMHARQAAEGSGPYKLFRGKGPYAGAAGRRMLRRWSAELPDVPRNFTFCLGSNADCRDSCLVFAGQNASEIYNTYRKVAQTMALLNEPEAFMRMLVAAVARHECQAPIEGMRPYMRMNVLSDIPWELVAPWFFDTFPRMSFYDYTKVPHRDPPPNYDLTFSLSGAPQNTEWAREEVEAGRRIAVVFLGYKRKGDAWVPIFPRGPRAIAEIPLPDRFWDLPVVDGDESDVRPLDPAPSAVGLRWKTPSGVRAGRTVDPSDDFNFVTPVHVVDGEGRIQRPNPAREQWLITALSPRYQPIYHKGISVPP